MESSEWHSFAVTLLSNTMFFLLAQVAAMPVHPVSQYTSLPASQTSRVTSSTHAAKTSWNLVNKSSNVLMVGSEGVSEARVHHGYTADTVF